MLSGKVPSDMHRSVMDCSLILYAEHEFNASTFTARVCAATLSDMYSCITGAIGSLRGPLHGGAMRQLWSSSKSFLLSLKLNLRYWECLKGRNYNGFGHAIYRTSDPRNAIIKEWSKKLAEENGDSTLFDISSEIAQVMWDEKELFPNADFFHASAYNYMSIPTKIFTPSS